MARLLIERVLPDPRVVWRVKGRMIKAKAGRKVKSGARVSLPKSVRAKDKG
jgi:hypothetical protein